MEKFLVRNGVLSGGVLDLNTLCKGYSNHTTLVGLLYLGGRQVREGLHWLQRLVNQGLESP